MSRDSGPNVFQRGVMALILLSLLRRNPRHTANRRKSPPESPAFRGLCLSRPQRLPAILFLERYF